MRDTANELIAEELEPCLASANWEDPPLNDVVVAAEALAFAELARAEPADAGISCRHRPQGDPDRLRGNPLFVSLRGLIANPGSELEGGESADPS